MDTLISDMFVENHRPGIKYGHVNGMFTTVGEANAQLTGVGSIQQRFFDIRQQMTYLGASSGELFDGVSDYSGFHISMLTPQGGLNMERILNLVRTSNISVITNQVMMCTWKDNHVALMVNLMRFGMLLKLKEENLGGASTLKGKFDIYNDGNVSIDLNTMNEEFGTAEPEEATFLPVPREEEARVSLNVRNDLVIYDDVEVVNAIELTKEQCMILYFMMCKWQRSTRYLLDFDLPVLTDRTVVFRRNDTFTTNEWLEKYFQNDLTGAQVQTTFTSKAVLSTLRAYVESNRLHEQFSVASTILAGVTCSMFADNAEGLAHVVMARKVCLPRFRSCRGRIWEIVDDMPAGLTGGGVTEFKNVTSTYERYLLACVIYTQAYQTGMFIRVMRYHNEDLPEDIDSTWSELKRREQQISLLAAEAIRKYVPVSTVSAGYTYVPGYSEPEGVTGLVLKTRAGQTRQSGYKMVESATEPGKFDLDVQVLGAPGVPVMILPVAALGDNNPYALKVKVSHEDFKKSRFRSTCQTCHSMELRLDGWSQRV